jgi:hypothetical protein
MLDACRSEAGACPLRAEESYTFDKKRFFTSLRSVQNDKGNRFLLDAGCSMLVVRGSYVMPAEAGVNP